MADDRTPMTNPAPQTETGIGTDLYQGLSRPPISIPCKYFYDERGSHLFDAICDLPEYYLTRSERALLDQRSEEIAAITQAEELVELGAGTARKTRHLIQALMERGDGIRYAPLDISSSALEVASASLSEEFPELLINGIESDFTESLDALDPDPGCLAAFLGSTIGNFTYAGGVSFLRRLRDRLAMGDWFLLGVDLVKSEAVLEAAYNDNQGITAEFNKNILNVVNQQAQGDFNPEDFDHLAFFNADADQIEMHLVARQRVQVRLERLDLELDIAAGERIHTEISRKFTRESTDTLLSTAGFELRHWYPSRDGYFGLALAAVP
jgi:L-histidine N-alpha-methyltransferase